MSDAASLIQDVLDFQQSFNRSYILVPQRNVEKGKFEPLLRPFRWWQPGHKFTGLEHVLRAAIVPVGQFVEHAMKSGGAVDLRGLLEVMKFLNTYQEGALTVVPYQDPLDSLWTAARSLMKNWPEDGLADPPPELQEFLDGWKDILSDEVLAADPKTVIEAMQEATAALRQAKQTTYNVVRTCGEKHLSFFDAELRGLLPADQVLFLHGLDAFPKNDDVAVFLRRFAEEAEHDHVRDKANEFADRVESGEKMSGFES